MPTLDEIQKEIGKDFIAEFETIEDDIILKILPLDRSCNCSSSFDEDKCMSIQDYKEKFLSPGIGMLKKHVNYKPSEI